MPFQARLWTYVSGVLYGWLLIFAYYHLSRFWDYFGFTLKDDATIPAAVACLVAALPLAIFPRKISTPAESMGLLIYLLVFFPSMVVPFLQMNIEQSRAVELTATLFASGVAFIWIIRSFSINIPVADLRPSTFWFFFTLFYVSLNIFVLISLRGQITFKAIDDTIYVQRAAAASAINSTGGLVSYAIAFLSYAFNPFLIAFGLQTRRWVWILLGSLGQIFMFGTLALRSTLVSPLLVLGIWYAFRKGQTQTGLVVTAFFGLALVLAPFMANYGGDQSVINQILSFVYLRTFLIAGACFGVYDEFFSINPHTFLSHTLFGRIIFHYPYGDLSIGQVVGLHLVPSFTRFTMEYNADFLATDGIGGFGLPGVPVAAVLAGLALGFIGQLAARDRTRMAAAASVPFVINLANTSLFTSLLTGGGLLLFLLIFLSHQAVDAATLAPRQRSTRGHRFSMRTNTAPRLRRL